jgi:hypothetical protein
MAELKAFERREDGGISFSDKVMIYETRRKE